MSKRSPPPPTPGLGLARFGSALDAPEGWPTLLDPTTPIAPPSDAVPPMSLDVEPLDASSPTTDWSLEIEPLEPSQAPPTPPLSAPPSTSTTSPYATRAPTTPRAPRRTYGWDLEPEATTAPGALEPLATPTIAAWPPPLKPTPVAAPPTKPLAPPPSVAAQPSISVAAATPALASNTASDPLLPRTHREPLRFHGEASEYFRIWVVNLFLTLITLGIYSAWAKVRKARWFAQHTSLAGDRFDFHGEPRRVLVGRLVAIVLLGVWTLSFELSVLAGLAVLVVFCAVGPLLFASAQRFRLANTSWRGLRFGFDVPRIEAYIVCVPLLLLWSAGSVLEKLGVKGAWYAFGFLATVVGLPWAHARLKQLQHHHAHYGEQQFAFRPAGSAFYALYLKAVLLVAVGVIIAAALAGTLAQAAGADGGPAMVYRMLGMAVAGLIVWLVAWPYFAARMQQIVWSHTELGHGVRFVGRMRGSRLWALVFGQTLLTLLTLGLYWPFATVAITRYRIESLTVESDDPLGDVAGGVGVERRAVGDAAADFFGLDLGW